MHTLRPATLGEDVAAVARLISTFESEPVSVEQVREWFEYLPEGRVSRRVVAEDDESGAVIGYSSVVREPWFPPDEYYVWLVVAEPFRGEGVGSALYADMEAFLREQSAKSLISEVRDNDPASLAFAEKRGYAINRHLFESVLDLATFNEQPFTKKLDALRKSGLRFFTLAQTADLPDNHRKLYELNRDTALDIPGVSEFMSFEEFEARVFGGEWFEPAGQIVAADGDHWVGMAAVRLYPESRGGYNLMTGVVKPYRGRGIAQALKLLAIRYARAAGMETLRTNNDSANAPMLAINHKLGYQPQPGKYLLKFE